MLQTTFVKRNSIALNFTVSSLPMLKQSTTISASRNQDQNQHLQKKNQNIFLQLLIIIMIIIVIIIITTTILSKNNNN